MKEILQRLVSGEILVARAEKVGLFLRPEAPQGVLCFLRKNRDWRSSEERRLQDGMLLIREMPIVVEVSFPALRCRDTTEFSLRLAINLSAQTDSESLQLIAENLLRARNIADKKFLSKIVNDSLLPYLKENLAEEEARPLFFGTSGEQIIQESVRQASQRLSFKYGLLLGQVLRLSFGGKVYEEMKKAEEEAERKAEVVRRLKEECEISTDLAAKIAAGLRTEGLTCAKRIFLATAEGVATITAADAANSKTNFKILKATSPVRSVKLAQKGDKTVLLAGTTDGVKMLTLSLEKIKDFTFEKGRHGFNSACILGDSLFASHSQFGLVRWSLESGKNEVVCHQPCRGVTTDGDSLFFATANRVVRFATPPQTLFECTSTINALLFAPPFLIAGTNNGRLYFFKMKDSSLTWYDTGTKIYSLGIAELQRGDAVLVGARTEGVRAITLLVRDVVEFASPEKVRWVAGASDYVFGVGYNLKTLYVWQNDRKLTPVRLALPAETYDICLLKGREG